MNPVLVALSEIGRRIGEGHPRAKLLDREVDQVHELHEAGFSYSQIAEKMQISKSGVAHVISGRRRAQTPAAWVELPSPEEQPSPKRAHMRRESLRRFPGVEEGGSGARLDELIKRWR